MSGEYFIKNLFLLAAMLCVSPFVYAQQSEQIQEEFSFSPDRPGMATGPGVMGAAGKVMWETGIDSRTINKEWFITLPTTMIRVGVCDFVELRFEYDGVLSLWNDKESEYSAAPLILGSKFHLCKGGGWVPEISFMANLWIPCTKKLCEEMNVSPALYLLFQNEVCDWFSIGYNIGGEWNTLRPAPDTFLALNLGFAPCDKVGLFVESYNYLVIDDDYRCGGICSLDAGVTWNVLPNLQLDLYAGVNVYQTPGSIVTIGGGIAWQIN